MRILVLTSVYPPLGYSGHDERCRQTVQGLARQGHQLQVLTSDHRLPPMGVPGEKGVFRELRLYPEPLEDSLLGRSYKATYAHERYNAESLEYRIRRFKPDVIYVWNMRGLSKSLLFRLQAKGKHVVYDLHMDWLMPEFFNRDPWYRWWLDNPSRRSKLYRGMIRVLGKARSVLGMMPVGAVQKLRFQNSYVTSQWLRGQLTEAGLKQVHALPVIYPAIDTKKITVKEAYVTRRHFMWAGRLTEVKGADIAVDAVGILKARGIQVSLDLFAMGEPSERKAKRERIEAAGLIDQVTMRGIRPGELSKFYADYDALLYTSRQGEPFSMTVLEAMFAKLPCLVTSVGGNQELLQHQQNALLFEPDNAEALADSIVEFLNRQDSGRELAENLIARLQVERSIDTFCKQITPLLAAGK
ncbi:glycosyltransferase family 4 protein [Coraliomargarita sp. SDUM461004]|uniref:Glycosyltransferase family 4 protein n=1 Tax=Thalassobacterium sedimentorum TaxID=3041258 RepID=A0ABU1AEH1_9BACT|nr:glycosyltransferase family 4 protein [Coraliomargarita sp. SDUM461004]MDQ8193093.1 glycosyltransferase family 4 protein [Coraliomargarita sp. SDUM461004]